MPEQYRKTVSSGDQKTEEKRIALVVMNVDEEGEDAFKRLMPPHFRVLTTRTAPDLAEYDEGRFVLKGGFPSIAATLPPHGRVDLIAFSCTSGTIAAGDDAVSSGFAPFFPGVPVTNPAIAATVMLRELGHERFALLTPYPPAIHEQLPRFFESHGYQVTSDRTLDIPDEPELSQVSDADILAAARELLAETKTEALFISCTAFRVVHRLERLKAALGVPVYSSTQLFAQHAIKLLAESTPTAVTRHSAAAAK